MQNSVRILVLGLATLHWLQVLILVEIIAFTNRDGRLNSHKYITVFINLRSIFDMVAVCKINLHHISQSIDL